MSDYTPASPGDIIRGSRWPPAEDYCEVRIENEGGWPAGADGWDWDMLLSRTQRGGTPDLTLDAEHVSLDGDWIIARFHADDSETATLPATRGLFFVEIKSTDGGGGVHFYDVVAGTAQVRNAAGEG